MSGYSKSVLFLRRCVSVRHVTLMAGMKTGANPLTDRWRFVQQTTRTPTSLTARLCRLQLSPRTSQHRLCTKAPCEEEYPPLPAYPSDSEQEKKEVYIVQVKGLPWSCTADDLLHFFSECRIRDGVTGIHLTSDRLGRPSGRAFIEMEHEEDVNKALEKHRQYLGPRYVEVSEVTNREAESILRNASQTSADTAVVRLRGIPFTCTEADIVHFFSGLDIKEKGITIVTDRDGRKSGDAFVWFSSQEAADEALQRDREVIGNRYIEVFPSASNEIHSSWRSPASAQMNRRPTRTAAATHRPQTGSVSAASSAPNQSSLLQHYVHMRGLPFHVSGEDIVKFFSPLVVSKILIECGSDGRPSGEADVFFSCHQDAVAAMYRDRLHIGARYIELFLNSAQDDDRR